MMNAPQPRFRFSRRMRLTLNREFQAAFSAGRRSGAGPLLVYARPNRLGRPRLGLSVSRRVGSAVRRNRIKRLLREAYRQMQLELPAYDVVLVVRPHAPLLRADEYGRMIARAMRKLEEQWRHPNPHDTLESQPAD